jgi:hypothetical protein
VQGRGAGVRRRGGIGEVDVGVDRGDGGGGGPGAQDGTVGDAHTREDQGAAVPKVALRWNRSRCSPRQSVVHFLDLGFTNPALD